MAVPSIYLPPESQGQWSLAGYRSQRVGHGCMTEHATYSCGVEGLQSWGTQDGG